MVRTTGLLLVAILAALCGSAPAEDQDAYLVIELRDLEIDGGPIPDLQGPIGTARLFALRPYATLEGPGEVHVEPPQVGWDRRRATGSLEMAIRTARGQEVVRGRLFVPEPDLSGMRAVDFSVSARPDPLDDREAFLRVKRDHYSALLGQRLPGAAWFRHQVRDAQRGLGQDVPEQPGEERPARRRDDDPARTYALVTGGLAVSETLQLDRLPEPAGRDVETVPIDSIEGITVREIDWAALTAGIDPRTDALAPLIPADQHAAFLPGLRALDALLDHAERYGAPVLQAFEPHSESAMSRQRYERQLGVSIDDLGKAFGDALVKSVAVTGSDVYFRTGTDVAVLLEAGNAASLRGLIEAGIAISAAGHPGAAHVRGEIAGVEFRGWRSPDRAISSFVAALGPAIVLTNSPEPLRRLVEVAAGDAPSLAASPEYRFFRDRHPVGDETAFVVLSDRTIRRWCGPRWRIGASRRTRAMAVVAEIQAASMGVLLAGGIEPGPVQTTLPLAPGESLTLGPGGVSSSVYGSLGFQTPIAELDIDRATVQEVEHYERWRSIYERRWRNNFDPIAARIRLDEDGIDLDLTVMPLIGGSEYRSLVDICRGAVIDPAETDRHEGTLLHLAMAVNKDSATVMTGGGMLSAAARAQAPELRLDPFGWMGESAVLYVEDSPLWDELAEAGDPQDFMRRHLYQLPVAVRMDVTSSVKLIAFLSAFRAFLEQTAPGMTMWENRTHNGADYVCIMASEGARAQVVDIPERILCYAPGADALIVALDEQVLQRALDRRSARAEGEAPDAANADATPWLGRQLGLQLNEAFLDAIGPALAEWLGPRMQLAAWSNIPILNEWKRLYPGSDPIEVHRRFWNRELRCPGGGAYVWDEKWRTMGSTVYGHPGAPMDGPRLPEPLERLRSFNAGLTFEHDGLRARVEVREAPP